MFFSFGFLRKDNFTASLHWLIFQTDHFLFLEWARAEHHLSESDRDVKNSYEVSFKNSVRSRIFQERRSRGLPFTHLLHSIAQSDEDNRATRQ